MSSETRMTTFAPFARHWSACVFCFWALPSAFVITYETFAFLNAATSAGRSCVSQRTDDFGSGSRTQMSALADFLVGFATAAVTVTLTVSAAITRATMTFFTINPPLSFGYDPVQWSAGGGDKRYVPPPRGLFLRPCNLVRGGHLLRLHTYRTVFTATSRAPQT